MNFISAKTFIPSVAPKMPKVGRPTKEKAVKPRKVDAILRKSGKGNSFVFIIFKHAVAAVVNFLDLDYDKLNKANNVDLLFAQKEQYSGSSNSPHTEVSHYFNGVIALKFDESPQPFSLVKYSKDEAGGRKITLKHLPDNLREACYFLELGFFDNDEQKQIVFNPDYDRALPELGKRGRKAKTSKVETLENFLDTPLSDEEREIVDQSIQSVEETVASNTTVEDNGVLIHEPTFEYPENAVDLPVASETTGQPTIARKSHHKAKKA